MMRLIRSVTTPDVIAALALVGLSAWALYYVSGLSARAAMFPRLAAGLLLALSVAYLIRELFRASRVEPQPFFHHAPRFVIALVLVVTYAVAFPKIGFLTATIVFVPLFATAIGMRRPWLSAASGIAFTAAVYVVFVVLLNRRLPPERIIELWRDF